MTEAMPGSAALYRLMAWLSPSYPVGAFSYSHGIEQLVDDGAIVDIVSLNAWLDDLLTLGSGRNDAILFAAAHRAAVGHDVNALADVAERAMALSASAERLLETTAQGRAFSDITRTAWESSSLDHLAKRRDLSGKVETIAYPVAVAAAAADHAIPLEPALDAYLHAFTANLVSAAVRLIPLGHTDGQRALRAAEPVLAHLAPVALAATLDDLSSTVFLADMAAMRHETQYTRLFRS